MAYVREKRVREWVYYQLVEGRRENGRVRQRVLLHLGKHPTVYEAAKAWWAELRKARADAALYERWEKEVSQDALIWVGYRLSTRQKQLNEEKWRRQKEDAERKADKLQSKLDKLDNLVRQGQL